jgi:hypothetical protein
MGAEFTENTGKVLTADGTDFRGFFGARGGAEGMAALVNVGLMAALKRRGRAILSHGVAFAIYATAGGMVVSQWVFFAAPMLGVIFVVAVPLAVLAHFAALFWRLRRVR